jgi:hypothetical protein
MEEKRKTMMIKKTILTGAFIFTIIGSNAQQSKAVIPETAKVVSQGVKSPEYTAEFIGELKPVSVDLHWKPILVNKCVKHHSVNDELLAKIKDDKLRIKSQAYPIIDNKEKENFESVIVPRVGTDFLGNLNTGSSPLDNSIAISNRGFIVSVANTSIEFYDTSGRMSFSNSISGFFNDPSITNTCDPVVIYDAGSDRFIFFAQECSGSSLNSKLLVCFSQTNDPNAGWWNYKLNGNPFENNTWFDYPKLAVSTNELYITGNSFTDAGVFKEALLFQIQKNNGYAGGSLSYQYWHNISSSPFTLLPVSHGQGTNYGPGVYLVATQSSGGSTIDFYDLTDDMTASNEKLNHYSISTTSYSPAADGNQLGTITLLDNGDCRALSGFYLDGVIHFVFHSDFSGGYNGINYNRLTVSTQKNVSSSFGLKDYEYSYPSIASFGTTPTDKSVMIGFGRTGATIYPEMRVVSCDNTLNWGSSVLVKSGEGYSDYTSNGSKPERWGDYTGMCRKHNSLSPTVWMNGMYGTTANNWATWIAEIKSSGGTTGIESVENSESINVVPNPIYKEFKTEFELPVNSTVAIAVYDIQGKLVKTLYSGNAYSGLNQFTFNTSNLQTGTYILTITSNNTALKNEKINIVD